MIFTYLYNETTYTVHIEVLDDNLYRAVINEREYRFSAEQIDSGAWLIDLEGASERSTVHTASHDDARYLQYNGQTFELDVPDTRSTRRRGTTTAGGALTAQMPGQVMAVDVSVGDAVEAGQTLVVLEAMKMEIRVSASTAGTVSAVHVSMGDVVERGQVLVTVEQTGD